MLFSTTRVTTVGRAIVSTLKNFELTSNRTLQIHDGLVTQNQLIACVERLNGGITFSRVPLDCQNLEQQAWTMFKNPSAEPLSWIIPFINISIWSSEALCSFRHTDNQLLGIPVLRNPQLDEVLEHEIMVALKAFSTHTDVGTAPTCDALAEKAFEDDRRRLVGRQPALHN